MYIERVSERLPRLQIQFRISRSFRPRKGTHPLVTLIKQPNPFQNVLAVLPTPIYTMLKLGKNSGYTRPTLFVAWDGGGKGGGLAGVN